VKGPRSRRARAGHTARSRKGSIPAEGTSILSAALPFARQRSRRDLGRGEAVRGDSKPHEQSRRRPGCPRRHEEGIREHRSRIALRLLSNVSARELLRAGHGSQAKRWAKLTEGPTQPASVGAGVKAGRELHWRARAFGSFGCARASYPGCRSRQASSRLREARTRWQRDGWTGAKVGTSPEKGKNRSQRRRWFASRWPSRGAGEDQSRALERAPRGKGPCCMEDISGRSPTRAASRGRAGGGLGSMLTEGTRRASDAGPDEAAATEMSEARPHTSREEDNTSRDEGETGGCGPPKRISLA